MLNNTSPLSPALAAASGRPPGSLPRAAVEAAPAARIEFGATAGKTGIVKLLLDAAPSLETLDDFTAQGALTERRLTVGLLPKQTDLPLSALAKWHV